MSDERTGNRLVVPIPLACEILSISKPTLYRVIGLGELRTIKVGKRRLVPVAELERFVASKLEGEGAQ